MGLKRTPLKKRKSTPAAVAKRRCDRLWAMAVRRRAESLCEFCGKPGSDAHHMVSRSAVYLRHSITNGVFLCKGCHFRFHKKESLFLWEWMKVARPNDWAYVNEHRNTLCKSQDYTIVESTLNAWLKVQAELDAEAECYDTLKENECD